jgi:hypothetical protein
MDASITITTITTVTTVTSLPLGCTVVVITTVVPSIVGTGVSGTDASPVSVVVVIAIGIVSA